MLYRVLESCGLLQQDAAINAVIKKVNQFFFAQPKLQIDDKESPRLKSIAAMSDGSRAKIIGQIGSEGWGEGCPWNASKLDASALHVNRLVRDVSHPEWAKLFKTSDAVAIRCVDWNLSSWNSVAKPDATTFTQVTCRVVLVSAVSELVLRTANVQEHIIHELLADVLGGAHANTVDNVLTGDLSEDFDVGQTRQWAKAKLPFIESCVARQQAIHVGLSSSEVARLEEQERGQKIAMYSNRLQQDVAC